MWFGRKKKIWFCISINIIILFLFPFFIIFFKFLCQQKDPHLIVPHMIILICSSFLMFFFFLSSPHPPFLSLSPSTQASPWYHHKKRYPPSHGPDGKPRSRVHNVQLVPSYTRHTEEESEEEVRLLDDMSHWPVCVLPCPLPPLSRMAPNWGPAALVESSRSPSRPSGRRKQWRKKDFPEKCLKDNPELDDDKCTNANVLAHGHGLMLTRLGLTLLDLSGVKGHDEPHKCEEGPWG